MDFNVNFVPTVELFQESRALVAAARGDDSDALIHYLLVTRMNELNGVSAVIEHLANLVAVSATQAGALVGIVAGLKDCEPSDMSLALAASEQLIELRELVAQSRRTHTTIGTAPSAGHETALLRFRC